MNALLAPSLPQSCDRDGDRLPDDNQMECGDGTQRMNIISYGNNCQFMLHAELAFNNGHWLQFDDFVADTSLVACKGSFAEFAKSIVFTHQ